MSGNLFPMFKWELENLYYNLESKQYVVNHVDGQKLFEFKFKSPIVTKYLSCGILLFQNNEKENNWIKCLDPNGGHEKWKIEYPWKIIRLEIYQNIIILEYHAYDNLRSDKGYEGERHWYKPNKFTIAINGESGAEIWRQPFAYSKIDYKNGVILSGGGVSHLNNPQVYVVDIESGKLLSNLQVNQEVQLGYYPHFVDETGIYYTVHSGSFGKIDKSNGSIIWEFDLTDSHGKKRKISDWLLLENGKLVLQTLANHPNGGFTCIFDPLENLSNKNYVNYKK